MTALARQHQKIFAIDATQSQVTAFRTTEDEEPIFSKTPDIIQTTNFTSGWLNEDNTGNISPFVEDVNGLFLTLSYNTAYLLEKGVPEYSATQTYYTNSFCQYEGNLYRCKADDTVGFVPTNTEKWDYLHTESYATSSIGTGEAVVATQSGNTFQFKSLVAGNNVTMSSTDDSITINASMNGYANFTANSPLTYSNGVLSLSQASSSANGYLTSSDWTSFNSKLSSTIFSANNSWTGTNTFSAITLGSNDLATTLSGKQDTISVSSPLSLSSNAISISQANSTTDGYLSSTDWTTFNGKQSAINANNKLSASYVSGLADVATRGIPTGNVSATSYNLLGTNSNGYAGKSSIYYDNNNYLHFSANSYIRDITGNTLAFNSTANFQIYFGGTQKYQIGADNLRPTNDVTIKLGHSSYKFGEVWNFHSYINTCSFYALANDTTERAYMVYANDGNFIIGRSNSYGSNQYITVKNVSKGMYMAKDATSWTASSDRRLKKNIISLENSLQKITRLNPVRFAYNDEETETQTRVGFIAQEVQPIIPEVVEGEETETTYLGISPTEFIPFMIKAIQELSAKVSVLENKLEAINGN